MDMRNIAIALAAAMAVGGCATTGNGTGNGNGAPAPRASAARAQYCWAERMEAIGSRFNCNWAASKEEACAGKGAFTTVDGTGYAYPRATTCPSGQRLMELVPKA
jgi:hypothetical protein